MTHAASSFQQRLFAHAMSNPTDTSYQIPYVFRSGHPLVLSQFAEAIRLSTEAFPELLTLFSHGENTLVRTIERQREDFKPYRIQSAVADSPLLSDFVQGVVAKPMDLTSGPLFRYGLFHPETAQAAVVLVVHHILADAPSMNLLINKLHEYYHNPSAAERVAQRASSFSDFVEAEERYLLSADYRRDGEFWREQFNTGSGIFTLKDHEHVGMGKLSDHGNSRRFEIPFPISEKTTLFSKTNHCSPYMVLLAASIFLIGRYVGQRRISVGVPVSARIENDWDSIFGPLLNFLPLCVTIEQGKSFTSLCADIRKNLLLLIEHSRFPQGDLLREYFAAEGQTTNPFQLSIARASDPSAIRSDGNMWRQREFIGSGTSKLPLALSFLFDRDQWSFTIEYDSDFYSASWILKWGERFLSFLSDALLFPERKCCEFSICNEEDHALIVAKSGRLNDWPPFQSIDQLVNHSSETYANNLAVSLGTTTGLEDELTYAQLNLMGEKVAQALEQQLGGGAAVVGISMQPTPVMIAILLGVFRAGKSYLPLDPDFPADRLRYMVEDSQCDLVIAEDPDVFRGSSSNCPVESLEVWLENLRAQEIANHRSDVQRARETSPDQLAYVIYTSGSTGTPKGTRISHKALSNFIESMKVDPGMASGERLYSLTTLSFDISILEIFLPLIVGGHLVLMNAELRSDPSALKSFLEKSPVGIIQATPSRWNMILDSGWHGDRDTQRILIGGEALSRSLADRLLENCLELWNMYGPTETTVWSLCGRIVAGRDPIYIGEPIHNTFVVIVDSDGNLCPPGVRGEIWIGGSGVADGYHNRVDLTAEKFVNLRHPAFGNSTFYKTGDLGILGESGKFFIFGRIDSQMKIRGHRIEPGEIEHHILATDIVRSVCVKAVVTNRGDSAITAYVIPREHVDDVPLRLRALLRQVLPVYMIPRYIVPLDVFPLTPNLKIDQRRLPSPVSYLPTVSNPVAAVSTEEALQRVVAEVLEGESPAIDDNLLHMGFHSLLIVRACADLLRRFNLAVTPALFLRYRTISNLAAVLDAGKSNPANHPIGFVDGKEAPLTYSQERYLALFKKFGDSPEFNVSRQLIVRGHFSTDYYRRSLEGVLRRHSALRTSIDIHSASQVTVDFSQFAESIVIKEELGAGDNTDSFDDFVRRETLAPFQLHQAPLVRFTVRKVSQNCWQLILTFHHIVIDGFSLTLLQNELLDNYATLSRTGVLPVREPTRQLSDYAIWERTQHDCNGSSDAFLSYSALLEESRKAFSIKRCQRAIPEHTTTGATIVFPILRGELKNLRKLIAADHLSISQVLLACFTLSLARIFESNRVLIHKTDSNRVHPHFTDVIGSVYNLVALPFMIQSSNDIRTTLVDLVHQSEKFSTFSQIPIQKLWDGNSSYQVLSFPEYCPIVFNHEVVEPMKVFDDAISFEFRAREKRLSKFELCLSAIEYEGHLELRFEYKSFCFSEKDIRQVYEAMASFLKVFSDRGSNASCVAPAKITSNTDRETILRVRT